MRAIAAVVEKHHAPFTIEEVEVEEPRAGEVLVRIVASGICHTDGITREGALPFPFPGVLGHEGAGIVEAVGEGVTSVEEGDRVVIGWPWCGNCRNCLDGERFFCTSIGPLAFRGGRADGSTALHRPDGSAVHSHFFGQSSFASYSIAPARSLIVVPEDAPIDTVGPLACGLMTGAGAVFNVVKPGPGSSIVVYGSGTVGLAGVMAARCSGATKIVAVDLHPSRLELAKELGATDAVNAGEADPVQAVREILGGPADASLECTGVISVVRQAADSVGMRGICVLIGGAPAEAEFALDHMSTLWGKTIRGTLGGDGRADVTIPALIELNRQGRFPFERLITRFPLEQVNEAMDAAYAGEVLKPVLDMPH
jgi:aryl-alcohol dehydrogenase